MIDVLKKYEGFRVDVKRKSIEDKVRRDKVFEVEEALNIENSRASSFQVRGINVDEIKVNAVRDWSSLKTLPEVRNNKVADAFQEEYELQCAEPLDGERNKLHMSFNELYVRLSYKNLASKALVKAFKLPIKPNHSPYQIGWIKKVSALKVTEVCKVPLAIGKHFVTCDVVDIEKSHVLFGRSWKHDMDATHQGVEDVMENAIPTIIKPLLDEFGKIVTDDAPDALPPLRNIQHQIDLSKKTTLLVSISNEVLGLNSIKELLLSNPKSQIFATEDCDDGSRPEEQHLVVLFFDEKIVKFPTQPATTEISREDGSNLEGFLIVLTREEVDIIRPIMAVEEEPLMMLGSGPNIIKEDFSNDLDGQHSTDENLYECLVETRNGLCAKKNMGSWYHMAQDFKGTP
ncbi:hypothetical protein Tco_1279301 [Tanacetum coccineum]